MVSTRRPAVLSLPLQQGFLGLPNLMKYLVAKCTIRRYKLERLSNENIFFLVYQMRPAQAVSGKAIGTLSPSFLG